MFNLKSTKINDNLESHINVILSKRKINVSLFSLNNNDEITLKTVSYFLVITISRGSQ